MKNLQDQIASARREIVMRERVQHTHPGMRGDLFERFISGLCGAAVAELGADRTKQALDAAKTAIDDFAEELKRHAH